MTQTCINCKYEPDWGPMTKGEYARQCGMCKWDKDIPTLPATMFIHKKGITRFSDDSGVMTNCKAWEAKS